MSSAITLNDYEAEFFGFTSYGLMNFYFNTLYGCWKKIVDETVLPRLLEHVPGASPAEIATLHDKLYDRIFQNGRFNLLLTKAERYLSIYILKIPTNVTLPGDVNKIVEKFDEPQLLNQINELAEEIIQMLTYKVKRTCEDCSSEVNRILGELGDNVEDVDISLEKKFVDMEIDLT